MTEEDIKNEILDKISKMELNTYLFPVGYTQAVNMTNYEWSYRTYNNGSTGAGRYHTIEIVEEGKTILRLLIGNDIVNYIYYIGEKNLKPEEVLFYVNEIFKEKHSFQDSNEGLKNLRGELNALFNQKESINNDIELKRKQIEDLIKLKNSKS